MKIDINKTAFFFIIGNPRSGTTLLRLMLNAHHDITVPPECGFFHWWAQKYSIWDWSNFCVDDYLNDLLTSRKIETWDLDFSLLRRNIQVTKPSNYYELSLIVYLTHAIQWKKMPRWIGDKNNYYINHLEELHKLAPNAKYILIIRDGRDVACSYQALKDLETSSPYKPRLPIDLENIGNEWLSNNLKALTFFKKIPENKYAMIKFEDLIINTRVTLEKLSSWFKIDFDEKMLFYYEENKFNKVEPESTLDWKKKTLEKPDPGTIGKYKKILNRYEIQMLNKIGYELLTYFKYI